jgi:hypothetical protein
LINKKNKAAMPINKKRMANTQLDDVEYLLVSNTPITFKKKRNPMYVLRTEISAINIRENVI